MKHLTNIFLLTISLLILSHCSALFGEEIGRIPVNKLSSPDAPVYKETTLDLKAEDEIGIWSNMDMYYEGEIEMTFHIEMLFEGERKGLIEFDPREKNPTLNEVKTSITGETNWSFSGKNITVNIESDGAYTFRAYLTASGSNVIRVDEAEIVFKK